LKGRGEKGDTKRSTLGKSGSGKGPGKVQRKRISQTPQGGKQTLTTAFLDREGGAKKETRAILGLVERKTRPRGGRGPGSKYFETEAGKKNGKRVKMVPM